MLIMGVCGAGDRMGSGENRRDVDARDRGSDFDALLRG